jgi:dynein heavy chain
LAAWKDIYDATDPSDLERYPYPGRWNDIELIYKIVIMRALRPDKVIPMIQRLIKEERELGEYYLMPAQSDLPELYSDSKNNTPIIIVISAGADPVTEIANFSRAEKIDYVPISLGKGQGKKAMEAIEQA